MMICLNCGEQYKDGTAMCQRCGAPLAQQQAIPPNMQYMMQQPQKKHGCLIAFGVTALIFVVFSGLSAILESSNKPANSNTSSISYTQDKNTSSNSNAKQNTNKTIQNEKKKITDCFEVVENASYKNSIGRTILIDKVLAKEDVSVSSTIILKDASENVIGKSEDTIHLVKGEYNYFRYYFENEPTDDTILDLSYKQASDWSVGTKDAVELVKYNHDDHHLYLSFKQIADEVSYFSRFKLLFYKDGKIVHDEDGYFSVYAENLNGKDSEDVAEITVYDIDFDEIEYICEP